MTHTAMGGSRRPRPYARLPAENLTSFETATTPPSSSAANGSTNPLPEFAVVLILFLAADTFSGQTGRLPLSLPVGADRILFAVFLVLLVVDGRIKWRTWRPHPATWLALAALIWAAMSALYHGTLTTSAGGFALLDRMAVPYLLFVLAPVALPTRRCRLVLLQLLVVLGVYLGATAVFEIIGPHQLVYPSFISNPNVGISFGRARGPFLASDADAAAMATCFFGSLAARALCSSPAWRRTALLSSLLCLAGVFLAFTRSEWIGMSVALLVTGLLVPSLRRRVPVALAAIAAVVTVVLLVSSPLRHEVTKRAATVSSVYDRENTNVGGLRALESEPLFGIGWTEFVTHTDRYVRLSKNYPLTHTDIEIHNVPLARFAELGLLGGGLWTLSVLAGPVTAMFTRRRRSDIDDAYRIAFVGGAIVWLVAIQFSPFPYPLPNALVWLLAGLVLAPIGQRDPDESTQAVASRPRQSLRPRGSHRLEDQ